MVDGLKTAFVGRVVAAQRADVIQRPYFASHDPVAGGKFGIGRLISLGLENGLIEARRQGIDQIDIAGKFFMLFAGDASGDEDPEVADAFVNRVNDRLAVGANFVDVVIEIEDPAQRLLRRRDVVALGAEHHDR